MDTLKLDRMFVWQLENNPQSEPVIEGLVHIAKHMGKKLIAEGVETQRQAELLKQYGCNMQQGFFYAPTMPENNLLSVLNRSLDGTRGLVEEQKQVLKR